LFSLILAVASFAPVPRAQFDTATVLGTTTDASGGRVAGARVTLKNIAAGITARFVSDANGIVS